MENGRYWQVLLWNWGEKKWLNGLRICGKNTQSGCLKNMNKNCSKCNHECHCSEELHADEYGVCTCENCEC